MAFVTTITLDGEKLAHPDWARVASLLDLLLSKRRGFLQMFGPDEATMTLAPAEELGCYVSAYGDGELAEYLLIEPTLGLSRIDANIGGGFEAHPRCVLVNDALVVRAAHEFFETGCRLKELSWADPFEVYSDAGIS